MKSDLLFHLLLFAPPPGEGGGGGGGGSTLIMMVLFMVIFWVLLIRPQRLRQKEHERRIASLKKGDHIITSGGIHGIITGVRERELSVRIAEGVHVELDRNSVLTIVPKDSGEPPAKTG